MIEPQSEFGRGYAYCLGMFLAHAALPEIDGIEGRKSNVWFAAASDHLYELEIPLRYSSDEVADIEDFKSKCFKWRNSTYTLEQKNWAIQKAFDLLRAYDEKNGVLTEKAQWE